MYLQITPLDHPYKRSRNNSAQQSIRELWLCYTGGTRLDSPSSIIMKQPLLGAVLTVCKEISVHRQHSHFLSTRNWFSPLLFLHAESPITTWLLLSGVDANSLYFHTWWKPRKKIVFPVLTKYSNWEILSLDLLFFVLFYRLYSYCKIGFSFQVYWLFLSTFFNTKWY